MVLSAGGAFSRCWGLVVGAEYMEAGRNRCCWGETVRNSKTESTVFPPPTFQPTPRASSWSKPTGSQMTRIFGQWDLSSPSPSITEQSIVSGFEFKVNK